MTTEVFLFTGTAATTHRLAIFNSTGQVFDFNDSTFKSLASATTPYTNATERADMGGTKSGYTASVNLALLNSTTTPIKFFADWYTDTGLTTRVSESSEFTVCNSELMASVNLMQVYGSGTSAGHLSNAASNLAARNYYAIRGQVVTDGSNTTTYVKISSTEGDSAFLGKTLKFFNPSGSGTDVRVFVTCTAVATVLGSRYLTLSPALPAIPTSSHEFIVEAIAPDNSSIATIQSKTNLIPASPAATGDAMTLTTGERSSIAAALLLLSDGIESGVTPQQALRAILAMLVGKVTGAGSGTETFKSGGGATTRVTVVVDSDGNRSDVTLNL